MQTAGRRQRVGVLGAGIIGLSTAVHILEKTQAEYGQGASAVEVTIIADRFSPHTTSDGSGGFWEPYQLCDTPVEKIRKWSEVTWLHMLELSTSPVAKEVATQLVSGYTLYTDGLPEHPFWKDTVLGFRDLTPEELKLFPFARWGFFNTTVQMDVKYYMNWLMRRFKERGGKVEFRTIKCLDEVKDQFDVIVNCFGVRAGQLVNDSKVMPLRGQLYRVKAPWIKHFYFVFSKEKPATHIFPLGDLVVVGGVVQEGNWNENVDRADSQDIWNRVTEFFPFIQNADVVNQWAGLRPGRTEVRLEAEVIAASDGKQIPVIHNYGHGGSGVTLHWGCAEDASALVLKHLKPLQTASSKL
ncbi:hypothetical protein C0Q70_15972 [Pomacea canaliculata]|uniref:FAD dependent oxidoreductase domain-containing protein n=1 Tax=Pomacea canaliculata TaxID=400727 RepID=A0A2T7NNJ4_POMCA|nr:D-amino-acid oxidase-like [Pomacea canaliculata]XP_025110317.1 D-amino-acid oxidase-like [Pomacea canaliculata]PVD22716.1 hypothetical protein C0Q70_15972 [Pomacea canaliculata]